MKHGRIRSGKSVNRLPSTNTRRPAAFTLIELLVVVAIISLLISILLPSLQRARKVAQSAACMANLRSTSTAMNYYASEWNQYLAGPNTSGDRLTKTNDPNEYHGGEVDPWQNADWISPTLGHSFRLPSDRLERIEAVFNLKLRCPSNDQTFDTQFAGPVTPSDPKSISVPSYLTPWWFHWAPSAGHVPFPGALYDYTTDVKVPNNYSPQLNAVGSPSRKVYTLDGASYVDRDTASGAFLQIDFQTWAKVVSGNSFSTDSPGLTAYSGNPYYMDPTTGKLSDAAKTYGYRHVDDRLNAAFFDGHVESMDEPTSRRNYYWFPRGTKIIRAFNTDDPYDTNGSVVE